MSDTRDLQIVPRPDAMSAVQLAGPKPTLVGGTDVSIVNTVSSVPSGHLVDLAHNIQKADLCLRTGVTSKLQMIVDQIRFLQEQARSILEETSRDVDLHNAACNFAKIPHKIYHLYKKDDGLTFFSMIGPEEWGRSLRHRYLGSYRLEGDQSWTPLEKIKAREEKERMVQEFVGPSVISRPVPLMLATTPAILEDTKRLMHLDAPPPQPANVVEAHD